MPGRVLICAIAPIRASISGGERAQEVHMQRASRIIMVSCLAGALLPVAAQTTAWGGTTSADITSVKVTGTASNPVITIRGHHFGARPAHNPSCHPGDGGVCGSYTGYDFGTKLYLVDKTPVLFSAGRYRPAKSELDSIGLVITTYTHTKIVYHFGSGYHHGHGPAGLKLKNGDHYRVTVRGAKAGGTVNY
jgi:hypothetical protein